MRSLPNSCSALAILSIAFSLSAPAHAETLADAVALAYQTNPQLLAQRAQLRAVNENYVQARAGAGLQLNAQADFAHQEIENTRTRATGQGDSVTSSLNLSQPLFAGGRLAASTDAAEAEVIAPCRLASAVSTTRSRDSSGVLGRPMRHPTLMARSGQAATARTPGYSGLK